MSDASKRVRETAVRLFGERAPGCSDGGCVFGHPGGMHTNAGCRCMVGTIHEVRSRIHALSRIAHELAREAGTL